jgi:hypothetical protein
MPGNPREMITMAERTFPGSHQACHPTGRSRLAPYSNHWLARRELRRGRLGNDTFGNAPGAERRSVALLRGCNAGERVRCAVVRWFQGI